MTRRSRLFRATLAVSAVALAGAVALGLTYPVALWAAIAMIVQDIFLTLMVQAEARDRVLLSGLLDMVGWWATLATMSISIESIDRHGLNGRTILILVAVSVANLLGTGSGTLIGKHLITTPPTALEARVKALEERVA